MLVRIAPAPVAHSRELAWRIFVLLCKIGGIAQEDARGEEQGHLRSPRAGAFEPQPFCIAQPRKLRKPARL